MTQNGPQADSPEPSTGRWIILRMAGPRTLKVAQSLATAGFDVWTPTKMVTPRLPRTKAKGAPVPAPITPTIVFARAEHEDDLRAVLRLPVSPHPAFSLFRYMDRVPQVSGASLQGLRDEEAAARPKGRTGRTRERGAPVPCGERVPVPRDAFSGLSLEVERSGDRHTILLFGSMRLQIETSQVSPGDVGTKQAR